MMVFLDVPPFSYWGNMVPIFTLSQIPSQILDKIIAMFLVEEKRTIEGDSQ